MHAAWLAGVLVSSTLLHSPPTVPIAGTEAVPSAVIEPSGLTRIILPSFSFGLRRLLPQETITLTHTRSERFQPGPR